MNNILELKGIFEQKKSTRPGPPELPNNSKVTVDELKKLKSDLEKLKAFWTKNDILPGALVSVYYKDVIAKSRRIAGTLCRGSKTSNSSIVGAKFSSGSKKKHIITHYIDLKTLEESIKRYDIVINILNTEFNGVISSLNIKEFNQKEREYKYKELLAQNNFLRIIIDTHFVEKFSLNEEIDKFKENMIISIYKTDIKTRELMARLGITLFSDKILDETTILLTPDELEILQKKAPYLISMAVTDITKLDKSDCGIRQYGKVDFTIPLPTNEPIIGVIDTLFDKNVYFSEWVEYYEMVPNEIEKTSEDYEHGTEVTSIIVDGPSLNPELDDVCGRFKVRHFGVALGRKFSSFTIIKQIDEIIKNNKDIRVWNLSLGSILEINKNFISPEAAILDKIQYKNDVIFVIAGTNRSKHNPESKMIGAPADSINSLVVNAVDFDNKPASYSRKGPVLSFFTKPDISYYGGDKNKGIKVYSSKGEKLVSGTSYAAPWISRKLAYLVNILGLSREVAKALIINSATTWTSNELENSFYIGHGVVPLKIDDILKSKNDEITFILSGIKEEYDTYTYNLPIPVIKEKHPFVAKATMCYFPACERNQGIDYTNTELDISFGRIKDKSIKTINNNFQNSTGSFLYEGNARTFFRKWDNVKHIREILKKGTRAKTAYDKGLWGISIRTKERLDEKYGKGIKFGVVITLKEISGANRIEQFIRDCSLRGWLVNRLDVVNRVEIYNIADEIIKFEE